MVRTSRDVVGKLDAVEAVTTAPTDGPQEIRERIAAAVRRVDRGAGVLIVTDMLGDTQTNLSVAVARARPAREVRRGRQHADADRS